MAFSGSSATVSTLSARDANAADLGASFVAITAVPGTGQIGPVATTFVETTPYLHLYNAGSLTIYPTFLKLHVTVVSTGGAGSRVQFTQILDSGPSRWSSAGTALTISNTNMNSVVTSGAQLRVGVPVLTAATANRRILSHRVYRAVIDVVEDTYLFSWGAPDSQAMSSIITSGTGVVAALHNYPPVAIGPGQNFAIYHWGADITVGTTFEVEFAYYEK